MTSQLMWKNSLQFVWYRGGSGLSPSPTFGLRTSFLLYKTQSKSPMGQKIGQSPTGQKIHPFRPEGPEKKYWSYLVKFYKF
jgi:hypothetical protein